MQVLEDQVRLGHRDVTGRAEVLHDQVAQVVGGRGGHVDLEVVGPGEEEHVEDPGQRREPAAELSDPVARVRPQRPDRVAQAVPPDYALGSHVAPLGLAFAQGARLPGFAEGAFVGLHGSWNRRELAGYKVVFVPFADGRPQGMPVDVLTGFLDARGRAQGRPAGVAVAADGSLLVADDVGNRVWRVAAAKPP